MYVRGTGVEYSTVAQIISNVSAEKYDGNIIVHADAGPIRRYSCTYGCGVANCGGRGSENGYGYRGRIIGQTTDASGTRRSWNGRRGKYACWHAYRDVMRAILTAYPHAVITSGMARYEGLAGFENTYPATADVNVGSEVQPAYMSELCACDDPE